MPSCAMKSEIDGAEMNRDPQIPQCDRTLPRDCLRTRCRRRAFGGQRLGGKGRRPLRGLPRKEARDDCGTHAGQLRVQAA